MEFKTQAMAVNLLRRFGNTIGCTLIRTKTIRARKEYLLIDWFEQQRKSALHYSIF